MVFNGRQIAFRFWATFLSVLLGGIAVIYALRFGAVLLLAWSTSRPPIQYTSLTSKSPDEKYLVEIFETPERGFPSDRQFQVVLYSTANTNKYRIIYHSPDEGPPGTERFIWSRDSRYFLLVGKRFCVETNAPFTFLNSAYERNEYGYLLYNVVESNVMCNSSQDNRYPRFFLTNLIAKDFDPEVLPELIRTNR